MKTVRLLATAAIALTVLSSAALAQVQTVTFSVSAINQMSVSGNPPALIVAAASAGGQPNSVTNSTTTYSITTNEANKNINAVLGLPAMPTGVTLSVSLAAPLGATSSGATLLSATAAPVVTGINQVNASGLGITFTLSASAAAGTVPSTTRTVTYTIVTGT